MKKNQLNEFKNKPIQEVEKNISDKRNKLSKLTFDLLAGKVKNVREVRHIKKDIAQLLTIKQEMEKGKQK